MKGAIIVSFEDHDTGEKYLIEVGHANPRPANSTDPWSHTVTVYKRIQEEEIEEI